MAAANIAIPAARKIRACAMAEPIKSITIVGGGSSGWLAAAFLARAFRSSLAEGKLAITLIESPSIGIIGVGEATAPSMPRTLREIGVDEAAFIRRCNATFKIAGRFIDWNRDGAGRPIGWANPFLLSHNIGGVSPGYYYSAFGADAPDIADFTDAVSPCPEAIRLGKGPRAIDGGAYDYQIPYSYHMDARAFAEMLGETGRAMGVRHILDDVTEVRLDERGFVKDLMLKEHGAHAVELVIDATGFHGVILGRTMGEPLLSYGDMLLNDRAIVAQLPHTDEQTIEPATRATALSAGWSFQVPLYHRVGAGYVYSSAHLSEQQAIDEFLAHIGSRGAGVEPKGIGIKIGKARRSWVNNCIALGLSSGFVEPLEATAIYSVDMALRWLVNYFPDNRFDTALQDRYNRLIDQFYEEIVDYIVLHFHLSNRDDSDYWRAVRLETPIPDRLAENLALWRCAMPCARDLQTSFFFNHLNYTTALIQKGFYAQGAPPRPGISISDWSAYLRDTRAGFLASARALPDHKALLRAIRGEDQPAAKGALQRGRRGADAMLPGLGGGAWLRER